MSDAPTSTPTPSFEACNAGPCPVCIADYGDSPANHTFCNMRAGHDPSPHMCSEHGHPFRLDGGPL